MRLYAGGMNYTSRKIMKVRSRNIIKPWRQIPKMGQPIIIMAMHSSGPINRMNPFSLTIIPLIIQPIKRYAKKLFIIKG